MNNKLRKIGVAVTASSFLVAGAWGISAADAGATSKAPHLAPSAKVIKCYRTYKDPKKIRCYEMRKRHQRHNGRDVVVIILVQVPTPKNPPTVIVVPSLPQPTTTSPGPTTSPPVSPTSPTSPSTGNTSPTSGPSSPTSSPTTSSPTGSPTATETGGTQTGSPTATETGGTDTGSPTATETGAPNGETGGS
ncbi:hypothetical protein AB0D42_08290 [Streptomyces sp. NPDC048304]|uniref:hypothetical protein n=1 Tax=Streptomyces sp. NPDC048304 TaxID=3154820 RepID=UPI0033E1DA5F